jgi:hypothetical protein
MYTKMDAEMDIEPNETVVAGTTMEINPAAMSRGKPLCGL